MSARRSLWDRLIRRDPHADTATELYGRLVTASRTPVLYADIGAPDTPEGRLEVLVLHVVLVLRRLAKEGPEAAELSRALSETFVTDMDDCLREMGVSDISVARKVKKAAAALFDRLRDYGRALDAKDQGALQNLLATHVLESPSAGDTPSLAMATRLAGMTLAAEQRLASAAMRDILTGRTSFEITG